MFRDARIPADHRLSPAFRVVRLRHYPVDVGADYFRGVLDFPRALRPSTGSIRGSWPESPNTITGMWCAPGSGGEALPVQLPFTEEQFFDLFVVYNRVFWPALVALWIVSVVASMLLFSARRPPDRWISAVLTAHWLWSALAYHVAFFTVLNPAAWVFAALFLIQGAVFLWSGVIKGRLSFARGRDAWAPVAWLLITYSLLYPGINAVEHLSISRIPAFGVPCPTMIFTAGMLMLAAPQSLGMSTVPVMWSAIGGSAAFLLGVRADYGLPIAGLALAVFSLQRQRDPTPGLTSGEPFPRLGS